MSVVSETPAAPTNFPKVKFSDLHPGERFSYDKTNAKQDMCPFMKTDGTFAQVIGLDITVTFDETNRNAEVYAIDRDPQ